VDALELAAVPAEVTSALDTDSGARLMAISRKESKQEKNQETEEEATARMKWLLEVEQRVS
jgi:hypothetical protein